MATYGELQTLIRENVIDLPTTVQNRVPTLIKQAVRLLQSRHNFKCMEYNTSVLTTTEDTRVLAAVPSDFKEFRGKPRLLSALGRVTELYIAPDVAAAEREYGSVDGGEASEEALSGPPKAIAIGEPSDDDGTQNFLVYPLPDNESSYNDEAYRIVIPYWRYLPVLTNSGDSNWFTVNAEEWIEYQATANAFFVNWDEERATMWTQRAAGKWQDVLNADKRFRLSMTKNIPISSDVHGPRVWRGDR